MRSIDEGAIDSWVKGLPDAKLVDIVSLLGKKRRGASEFGYYPFRSDKEPGSKRTFQQWLDQHYRGRFHVHEFPTVDALGIPPRVLEAVTCRVLDLLYKGRTVVVVDSAGAERTARVCEAIKHERVIQGRQPNNRIQPMARRVRRGRAKGGTGGESLL